MVFHCSGAASRPQALGHVLWPARSTAGKAIVRIRCRGLGLMPESQLFDHRAGNHERVDVGLPEPSVQVVEPGGRAWLNTPASGTPPACTRGIITDGGAGKLAADDSRRHLGWHGTVGGTRARQCSKAPLSARAYPVSPCQGVCLWYRGYVRDGPLRVRRSRVSEAGGKPCHLISNPR
jgi:hypothetical protein